MISEARSSGDHHVVEHINGRDILVMNKETQEFIPLSDILDEERNSRIYNRLPTTKLGKHIGKKLYDLIN